MATVAFNVTIPDDKIADLLKAVDHRDPKPDGEARTAAEVKEWFEARLRRDMRRFFRDYKRWEYAQGTNADDLSDA